MFYSKNSRRILSAFLLSFFLFNVLGFGFNQISAAAENIKETVSKGSIKSKISPDNSSGVSNGNISSSVPSFTYLGLEVTIQKDADNDDYIAAWPEITGSLASGFILKTDPKNKAYYVRLTENTDTNLELARGVYSFVLFSDPSGPVVSHVTPAFHLYADGQGKVIMLNGSDRDPNWRLDGDLPVGEYKYQGKVTGVNGVQSDNIFLTLKIGRGANVPANQTPIAKDDFYATKKNTRLIIAPRSVLDNDTDPDGAINVSNRENFSAKVETWPKHGQLIMCVGGGCFSYMPEKNFVGTDTFTYRAFDGQASSNLATVTIKVSDGAVDDNQAPVAVADSYSVATANALNVPAASGVLANDVDLDGPEDLTAIRTSIVIGLEPEDLLHGKFTLREDGSFSYKPVAGFVGVARFWYKAFDGQDYSRTTLVTINVTGPGSNQAPVANGDTYRVNSGNQLNIDASAGVLANDVDLDGPEDLTAIRTSIVIGLEPEDLLHGKFTLREDGSFSYKPVAGFVGVARFWYKAFDGQDYSRTTLVKINVTGPGSNQAPIAKDDFYATRKNTRLIIAPRSVLDNDVDPDGGINISSKENFSVKVETWPKHGQLIMCTVGGCFSYMPEKNFVGTDTFTYRAFDGQASSNLATVTIKVADDSNQAPVAVADSYSVTTANELNVTVASGVLTNDTDSDGPLAMTAVLVTNVGHGTLTLASDGSFSYQSVSGFTGADYFTYKAFDGLNYSPIATSTITVNAPSSGGGGGGGGGSSSRQPNNASILINNNASATNSLVVTLTMSANNMTSQYAPLEMKIGNFSDLSSVAWRSYSTTTTWTLLNGIGQKTVYAQFRNSRGTSVVVNDSINYTSGQVLGDRDCSSASGTLIAQKNTKDAAVYFIAADCKKYVFPDPKTYYTWYENFNTVRKVEVSELDLYANGGVISYRPGTKLITHPDTQKVYAVEANGNLRYIPNLETARNLYGINWTSLVQDVIIGYFFTSYNPTGELMDAKLPNGTLVKARNSDTIYYLDNGQKRPFSSNYSFERNYFRYQNIITKDNLDNYPTGSIIDGPSSILSPYRIAY